MLTALPGCASAPETRSPVTWEEIAGLPHPPADHRVAYGSDPQQFGELRLPPGPGPHPVAVIVHGGCWRSQFTLEHITPLSAALTRAGTATWTLEYRRVGNPGGGWPGTFQDVARGVDHLRELARTHPLDLSRVVTVGHSAGGHLALWAAARHRLPAESPLFTPDPLPVRGVVPLAAISDLAAYAPGPPGSCNAMVPALLGGTPAEVPARYAQGSPSELLPLGVPVRLVHGARDPIVPLEQSRSYERRARAAGDDARLRAVEGAGHFDVIAPHAPAYRAVEEAVRELTGGV